MDRIVPLGAMTDVNKLRRGGRYVLMQYLGGEVHYLVFEALSDPYIARKKWPVIWPLHAPRSKRGFAAIPDKGWLGKNETWPTSRHAVKVRWLTATVRRNARQLLPLESFVYPWCQNEPDAFLFRLSDCKEAMARKEIAVDACRSCAQALAQVVT